MDDKTKTTMQVANPHKRNRINDPYGIVRHDAFNQGYVAAMNDHDAEIERLRKGIHKAWHFQSPIGTGFDDYYKMLMNILEETLTSVD